MNEDRLTEIETKLAFAEVAVQELSDLVYAQQQTLDRLLRYSEQLLERINTLSDAPDVGDPAADVPPHY